MSDAEEVKKKIRDRYEVSQGQDLYAILGVSAGADTPEIKAAFRTLVREFHTDCFSRYDLDAEHSEMLEGLLARINEAGRTLGDEAKRAEYDASDEGDGGGDVSAEEFAQIFEADDAFRKGKGLIERGEFEAAEKKFKVALDVNPEDPETQVYYAYTCFMNEPIDDAGNRSARAIQMHKELQRLAKEHSKRVEAQLFYAKSLKILGKSHEAIQTFEKVLEIDRNNTEAVRELRIMKMRSGANKKKAGGGSFLDKLKGLFKK